MVRVIREAGHQVYDFRNPRDGNYGFHWQDIDPEWQSWSPDQFIGALDHSLAREGYSNDFGALEQADAVVLVMPCGRSAHLELGYAVGTGKLTIILLSDGEPELMYKMVDRLVISISDMLDVLSHGR